MIGRYQVVETLGRGAMGIVYKGFDPNIGRTVAIKTILLDTGDPEMIRRFRREAQAAGVLNHPNIVTIYDAGQDGSIFYIAMEFVEGQSLHERLSSGPMSLEDITKVIEDIGSALDHAHSRQIVHRDIKPANIMLTGGRAKVMDFGVARIASVAMTTTGTIMGTPAYLSPEAVSGKPVDGRSDIFALGVVLYEMLTGVRPFQGDSIPTVIFKIVGEEQTPVTTVNKSLHPGLNHVIGKALAKDPATRYQGCAEMVTQLKNFRTLGRGSKPAAEAVKPASIQNTEPHPAPASRRPAPVSSPASKRNSGWLAIGGVGLLAGAIGIFMLTRGGTTESNPPAPPPSTVAAPGGEQPAARPLPRPAATSSGSAPEKSAPLAVAGKGGEVLIKSNVEGAAIRVDGQSNASWITPARVPLTPGAHRIELAKEGYRSKKAMMNLTPTGPFELTVNLTKTGEEPAPPANPSTPSALPPPSASATGGEGRIQLATKPPNAFVLVDGTLTKYRTPVNFALPAGRHKIEVYHRGNAPVSRDVVVSKDQITPLVIELAPAASRFPGLRR